MISKVVLRNVMVDVMKGKHLKNNYKIRQYNTIQLQYGIKQIHIIGKK